MLFLLKPPIYIKFIVPQENVYLPLRREAPRSDFVSGRMLEFGTWNLELEPP